MEQLVNRRGSVRRRATTYLKRCEIELKKVPRNDQGLRDLIIILSGIQEELVEIDNQINGEMDKREVPQTQVDKEKNEQSEYQERIKDIRRRAQPPPPPPPQENLPPPPQGNLPPHGNPPPPADPPVLSQQDRQRVKRENVRKIIDNLCAQGEEELLNPSMNVTKIFTISALLEAELKRDEILTNEIIDLMINDGVSVSDEMEIRLTYQMKVGMMVSKITSELKSHSEASVQNNTSSSNDIGASSGNNKRKRPYKLPEIDPVKFDGEIGNWLEWWTEFSTVHEDADYDDADKLKWMGQTLIADSPAHTFFIGHIRSKKNYKNIVEEFQKRFGKKHLLEQHYIRELQRLILTQHKTEELTLSALTDKIRASISSLRTIGVDSTTMEKFIVPLIESALPEKEMEKWQNWKDLKSQSEQDIQTTLKDLMDFLMKQVENETQRKLASSSYLARSKDKVPQSNYKLNLQKDHQEKRRRIDTTPVPSGAALVGGVSETAGSSVACIFCSRTNHYSQDCKSAHRMDYDARKQKALDAKACFACLRTSPVHRVKDCQARLKCFFCAGNHYPILCPRTKQGEKSKDRSRRPDRRDRDRDRDRDGSKRSRDNQRRGSSKSRPNQNRDDRSRRNNNDNNDRSDKNVDKSSACTAVAKSTCTKRVILSTCVVKVVGPRGVTKARLLKDTGSQFSYVAARVVKETGCEKVGEHLLKNLLFGGQWSNVEKVNVRRVHLQSVDGSVSRNWHLREKSVICPGIPRVPDLSCVSALAKLGVFLTDQEEEEIDNEEIEILIGQDLINEMLLDEVVRPESGLNLRAENTIFGWMISGSMDKSGEYSLAHVSSSLAIRAADIAQLWDLERIGISDPVEVKTKEQEAVEAEKDFQIKVSRNDSGQVVVGLPWIGEKRKHLPSNLPQAKAILHRVTEKLQQTGMLDAYNNEFQKWENDEIIERVPEEDVNNLLAHYLPHRPVIKPESKTTPIRPVFNASFKTGRNLCLNECLYPGPNLLEQIPTVLMRFREKAMAASADIRKAFLMVKVREEDRDVLRFLWRNDEGQLLVYRFTTVVFGVNCSPFLLAATLRWFLAQIKDERKWVALKLIDSMYVDNTACSCDTREELLEFQKVSVDLLKEIHMDLREWKYTDFSESESPCKLLGMIWDNKRDELLFDTEKMEKEIPVTKRNVLSQLHSLFDPLGIACPATLPPKVLLQSSWEKNLRWDQEFDPEDKIQFHRWFKGVESLKTLRIPRQLVYGPEIEFHCFCDASKSAYAAVVFLRSKRDNKVKVQLVMAKSRLTPVKKITIPRLELMACVLGVRLVKYVIDSMKISAPVTLWSDSSTALCWISRSSDWGRFVGNRVKDVLSLYDSKHWRFVPGSLNPADLPSRGCTPTELVQSKWWEGPTWLYSDPERWPKEKPQVDEEEVMKEKKINVAVQLVNIAEGSWFYDPKSIRRSFRGAVKVMGFVLRFVVNSAIPVGHRTFGRYLRNDELLRAEKRLLQQIQRESFPSGIEMIGGKRVEMKDGMLCINSQLLHKEDKARFKWPVVLSVKHPLVLSMIKECHEDRCHAGVQIMLGHLRERFWIIKARQKLKSVIFKCQVCKRYNSKPYQAPGGLPPSQRLESAEVFENVGVDLFGPLTIQEQNKNRKVWVAIFTCAVYRCVHLDVVDNLSTEAFVNCLERFVNQYGRPSVVFSDNGTNFVGTKNLFKLIKSEDLMKSCEMKPFVWKMNPPSAPWWGGFWERLIRSIKDPMRKVMKKTTLNYDQLRSVLSNVAAVVNDRPLTYVAEDEGDLLPLRPSMFLHGTKFLQLVEGDQPTTIRGLGKAYREMKRIQQQLQTRFRIEYLASLVQRGKDKKGPVPQVGDIVLIHEDNKKKLQWTKGRIVELNKSRRDGVTRVAKVATPHEYVLHKVNGIDVMKKVKPGPVLTRPIQRLYPLEIPNPDLPHSVPVNADVPKLAKDSQIKAMKKTKSQQQVELDEDVPITTRSGRNVKKPERYGEWMTALFSVTFDQM